MADEPPERPANAAGPASASREADAFADALAGVGAASLNGLQALEVIFRRMGPVGFQALRDHAAPLHKALEAALAELAEAPAAPRLEDLVAHLRGGATAVHEALGGVLEPQPERILGAMHAFAEAQGSFYGLRDVFPPLQRFFAEPHRWDSLDELDPASTEGARVGLHHAGGATEGAERGGFTFYVPEHWDGVARWPLVVALHGGAGSGPGFVWSWLREARSRGFFLLAPTSRGSTWSFMSPDTDAIALRRMLDFLAERWPIDRERVLLTGLSDGATFTLLAGLAPDAPYTALAPVSGVLHPFNHVNGNLERASGRRIHLVHGALDWMFPIDGAREARDTLVAAGADLVFHEIEDLSHAYPREHNGEILRWFDRALAADPPPAAGS